MLGQRYIQMTRMPRILRITGVLMALAVSTHCAALGNVTGKIVLLRVIPEQGLAFVHVNLAAPGTPACNVNVGPGGIAGSGFVFRTDSPGGKSVITELLHAQTMGYNIHIVGTGSCSLWSGDREDLLYVDVTYP